jgi:AbiJ-like protein
MDRFSDRNNYTKARDVLQIENMDNDLRTAIKNLIYLDNLNVINNTREEKTVERFIYQITEIWTNFFRKDVFELLPESRANIRSYEFIKYFREWIDTCQWYEVYNLIEFMYTKKMIGALTDWKLKKILKENNSGYRIETNRVIPISNKEEINEIKEVFEHEDKYNNVKKHIDTSIVLFTNREHPDYRNSIKESISAVESLVKIIVGKENATLGEGLSMFKEKIVINEALKKGFKNIYGYTSSGDGIRHAYSETKVEVTFEDAKYMLVTCSAFVNYLITKHSKMIESNKPKSDNTPLF